MSCCDVQSFRWYHHPLKWVGIVRRFDALAKGKRGTGNLCDQCKKSCIENCRGTCYCNIYTGACLCEGG